MPDHDPLVLLTPDQVCEMFQVTKSWLYDMVQQKRIKFVRLGGKRGLLRFRRTDLEVFLDEAEAV